VWTGKADHVVSESPMSALRMSVNIVFIQFAFRAMTTLYATQSLDRRDPGCANVLSWHLRSDYSRSE
jgi:hypothetical protein